jgi:hypothetical protein
MSEGAIYGPVPRENTDTKQDPSVLPSPYSRTRLLFYFFVVIGMLCGVACLVSVGLWGSTWGCNESEASHQTVGYIRVQECGCSVNYPILLGIVGASLTATAACALFLRSLQQTSVGIGIWALRLVWTLTVTVTIGVFILSVFLTCLFWFDSQATCGPELYNMGYLVLFMVISTILALCCGSYLID